MTADGSKRTAGGRRPGEGGGGAPGHDKQANLPRRQLLDQLEVDRLRTWKRREQRAAEETMVPACHLVGFGAAHT